MKVLTDTTSLKKALDRAAIFAPKKSPMPVLASIVLTGSGAGATLTGSNLEESLTVRVAGSFAAEFGRALLPCKLLLDTLRNLPKAAPVEIVTEEGVPARLNCAGVSYPLPAESLDNYPALPKAEKRGVSFTIPAESLAKALARNLCYVSRDELRPQLAGVHFRLELPATKALTIQTTDGHRLLEQIIDIDFVDSAFRGDKQEFPISAIIPAPAIAGLCKILSKVKESVSVNIGANGQVCFIGSDYELYTRSIEGKFPNCEAVMPDERRFHLEIERESLAETTRRLLPMSNEISRQVSMSLNGRCILTAEDPDREIPATSAEFDGEFTPLRGNPPGRGKYLKVGYNAGYILDILKAFDDSPSLVWEFNSPSSAALLTCPAGGFGGLDDPFRRRALLMPVRLPDISNNSQEPADVLSNCRRSHGTYRGGTLSTFERSQLRDAHTPRRAHFASLAPSRLP